MSEILAQPKIGLRQAINDHCKNCVYDPVAAGTWRAQVTLCSVTSCALHPVRPTTKSAIPESTLDYYAIPEPERGQYRPKRALNGRFSEQHAAGQCHLPGECRETYRPVAQSIRRFDPRRTKASHF